MATALRLVSFNVDGKAELHEETLKSVLDKEEVRNRHVVVISIAGCFRRGKSFLLNYVLRFLQTKGEKSFASDDKIEGFDWKYGMDRVTTGIYIWSEVFIINDVAVLLIDTQGTFDKETSIKVNTAIVAIGSLISSVQILNYHERLDSQDLMNLEFFLTYGKLLQRENYNIDGSNFFQKLLFLIRDWNFKEKYAFGYDGGDRYLKCFVESSLNADLVSVNKMLHTCFDEVQCYLMPHPGDAVASSQSFGGHMKEIDEQFLEHANHFARSLLLPENLVTKRIAGKPVTGHQLVQHIRACISLFNSDELPQPKTMYNSFVDELSSGLVQNARNLYYKLMRDVVQNEVLDETQLDRIHQENLNVAMKYFVESRKIGSDCQNKKHEAVLNELILDDFSRFKEIMVDMRQYNILKKELEIKSKQNDDLQNSLNNIHIEMSAKQDEIEIQNRSILSLQESVQESERRKQDQEGKLVSLNTELLATRERNEEANRRTEELRRTTEDYSRMINMVEKNLDKSGENLALGNVIQLLLNPTKVLVESLTVILIKGVQTYVDNFIQKKLGFQNPPQK